MRRILLTMPMAFGTALAVSGPALAADPADPYAPPPERRDVVEDRPAYTDIGVGLLAGGGVTNFTNSYINSITDPGGVWNARLVIGTRSPVAFEAAYNGSAQNIRSIGLSNGSLLLGNGAEGDLRLNLVQGPVEPYLFGGVAWKHYRIVNQSYNTSSLRNNDDVLELPVGAGLTFRYEAFMLDGRFDYRPSFYDNLLAAPPDFIAANPGAASAGLNNWNLTARIGYEF